MEEGRPASRSGIALALLKLCYSPVQLRALITAILLGGWYALSYSPTTTEIDDTAKKIEQTRGRLTLAKEIEHLRRQVALFKDRIPRDAGPNEWLQYMLVGSRQFRRLKLESVDTTGVREVKPYKAVVIRLEVEGPFREIEAFLRWLESNPRLLRLDTLALSPVTRGASSQSKIKANVLVLGING